MDQKIFLLVLKRIMIYANTRMHAMTTNEPTICSNLDFLFSKDSLPHEKQ